MQGSRLQGRGHLVGGEMGKGEARKNTKITIGRGDFKAYIANVTNNCDDAFFAKMAELFLTLCGVIDADGNLTEEYANSPFWVVENNRLKPSEIAGLMNQLSPEVRAAIENMEEYNEQHNPDRA